MVTSHHITHKAFVCSNEGRLCISIGLIEVLGIYYTLLLNVKLILTRCRERHCSCGSKSQYC
ncbi:Uncharacterised protein [Segatella copri]|nr:Uncharacterised protein [Segatella copri]